MARLFNDAATERLIGSFSAISAYPVSISIMFYDDDGSNNDRCMVAIEDVSQTDRFFHMNKNQNSLQVRGTNLWDDSPPPTGFPVSTGSYTANQWHQGGLEFVSTTSRFALLDGVRGTESTATRGTPVGIDTIIAGFEEAAGTDAWSGSLAEFGVWTSVLTDAEWGMLAAGHVPLSIRPQSLIFYSSMIRGATATGGNDFDIVGGVIMADTNTVGVFPHPAVIRKSASILQFPPVAAAAASSLLLINRSIANYGGIRQ